MKIVLMFALAAISLLLFCKYKTNHLPINLMDYLDSSEPYDEVHISHIGKDGKTIKLKDSEKTVLFELLSCICYQKGDEHSANRKYESPGADFTIWFNDDLAFVFVTTVDSTRTTCQIRIIIKGQHINVIGNFVDEYTAVSNYVHSLF